MSGGIPIEAVPVSVVVLLYSIICFTLAFLLVLLLINFGERWTYVTILSAFTALSTLGSIIQQLHYAISWKMIKEAQFDKAVQSLEHPGLAIGGAAQPLDVVLFFIQFYCYNVMSLNILFWTVQLFTGSWGFRNNWLGNWHDHVPLISKVFSVIFPGLIIGLLSVQAVTNSVGAFIAVAYISMFTSLSVGGILLILILYKYVKTRRLVAGGYAKRGHWWASSGTSRDRSRDTRDFNAQGTVESGVTSNSSRSIYDRALLIRFSIGFMILAIFEVAIIIFTLFQAKNNASIAASGAPNYSISNTVSDIVLFIPGVTASLTTFLVFGTTKSWRQYRDLVLGGCGIKRKLIEKKVQRSEEANRGQGLEFQRLDSLQGRQSEEIKRKEAENRVRMFVRETGTEDFDESEPSTSSRPSTNVQAGSRQVQFQRPMPADTLAPKQPSSSVVEVSVSVEQEDEVIQYERNKGINHAPSR